MINLMFASSNKVCRADELFFCVLYNKIIVLMGHEYNGVKVIVRLFVIKL